MAEKKFEASFRKLETIVEKLEAEGLALEDSLKLYEEGVRLSHFCAKKLAEAVFDVSEFLWSIRNEERFNTAFKSTPGEKVAYHAPCHLRAQGVGFKGRDLLRKIPGVKPATAIHYLKFHDGLKSFSLTEKFMEDLKGLIIEIHHKTMSEKEDDYPCKCGGWCEKDFK